MKFKQHGKRPDWRALLAVWLTLAFLTAAGFAAYSAWQTSRIGFAVHFVDVGQGDGAIVVCDGKTLVIDGGTAENGAKMVEYLQNTLHVSKVDFVIGTHPHADHIGGLPDFKALRFTRYNQYESIILPMTSYLKKHGVQFFYNTKVVDVKFDIKGERKMASSIVVESNGEQNTINLTENDLLFITNGGCVENSSIGSQNEAAKFDPELKPGNGWDLWKRIAAQDESFGHPDKFIYDAEQTNWESATITTLDEKIPPYIQKICKRDPFTGHTVTGGIVTVKDSSWLMSWTLNRQQQFHDQPKNQLCVWVYALFTDKPGDYVKKSMRDCTGKEICMEWLYHIGVPEDQIEELAEKSANTVPVMMPYIDAFFMPRAKGDRPDIVPKGAVNFAFLGQFAETARDTIFTTEYSMRTGMEAVYTLLNVDRGVPEVWGSTYDLRDLINATVQLRDGKKISDMELPFIEKIALKEVLKKIQGTDIEKFLKEYNAI